MIDEVALQCSECTSVSRLQFTHRPKGPVMRRTYLNSLETLAIMIEDFGKNMCKPSFSGFLVATICISIDFLKNVHSIMQI